MQAGSKPNGQSRTEGESPPYTKQQAIKKAQTTVARRAAKDRDLVAELIAERRRDGRRGS